jgi:flagellar basal body-associated protein FliL
VNFSNRPIYKRRRRIALLIFVLLVLLLLAGLFLIGLRSGETGSEQIEQVEAPTVEQTPEVIDEQTTREETVELEAGVV